ncbi:MAG: hypothetical protein OXF97_02840 [Nitrospira sp.]|nr:hypothetical protein [Nitrospira sp.]
MQVTIAHLSEANKNERIDSQFFLPEFVDSFNTVANAPYSMLSDIAHVTDGNHVKIAENFDDSEGIRYLRGQDLGTDMMLHDRNIVHIPESCFKALKRSHIFKDDILITIVGANTGLVGLVYEPSEKLVANCKLGIARVEISKIIPGYLYAFLIGRYGQHQILRSIRGGGQTGLILPDIRQLRIARLSSDFESRINDVSFYGHSKAMESKRVYGNAQNILLSELGLTDWQPKRQLTFVKNYSDTEQAERIDAEYFQPKYEEIANTIKAYKGGWDTLGNLVALSDKNYKPKDKRQYKYIELANITGNGEIADCMVEEGQNLPSRARRKVKTGDLIVSSIEGSLSSIALIDKEYNHALCSTGFHVINSKNYSSETLLVLLKSVVGQLQLKNGCSGTILTAINKDEFGKIFLPIISTKKQTQIQEKVIESFNLRKQSKYLLERAKRAVEVAIEQDEKTASGWLENETKERQIS